MLHALRALAVLLAVPPFGPGPGSAPETRLVRVGVDTRGEPWAYLPGVDDMKEASSQPQHLTPAQIGRLEGLDVDITRALDERMRERLVIVPTRGEEIEQQLLGGKIDLILNGWTPSAKTLPGIRASDPYYTWGLLIATRSADKSVQSMADLDGRRLGHIADPAVLPSLEAMVLSLGARLVEVDRGGDKLFERLGQGELDAVVFDSLFVRWRVARDPAFRAIGEPLNRLGCHVGVRETDRELFLSLQAAVRSFVASPDAPAMLRKWESPLRRNR
jgi:polar amino acid transport system substrate-binding protein